MSHPIAQETIPEPGAPGAILARVPAFRAVREILEEMSGQIAILEIGPFDKPLTYGQREAVNRFLLTARAQGFRAETTDNEWIVRSRVVIRNRRRQEV